MPGKHAAKRGIAARISVQLIERRIFRDTFPALPRRFLAYAGPQKRRFGFRDRNED
jgi:hypothetical protein